MDKINLNIENLEHELKSYLGVVSYYRKKNKLGEDIEIKFMDRVGILRAIYNNDRTVTLSASGDNREEIFKLINYLKLKYPSSISNNVNILLNHIKESNIGDMLYRFERVYRHELKVLLVEEDNPHCLTYYLSYKDESIVLKLFSEKSKLQIQGKPLKMYSNMIKYFELNKLLKISIKMLYHK